MSEFKYPHLFEPITLAGTFFRNRIFAAPTGYQNLACDGVLPEEACHYYSRKAMGGCASVATCELIPDGEIGRGSIRHIALDNQATHRRLSRLANAIARHGAVPTAELQHAGMFANRELSMFSGASRGIAYGPVECEIDGRHILAMDEEMIERTIRKYADAARTLKSLGFGMILLHAGHGWMLQQWLSPTINTRTDKWGGDSIENRSRLCVAICDAMRREVGPRFPIEVRISGSECYDGGYDIETGIAFSKQLEGHVDLIHVSAGNHEVDEVFAVTHPSMFLGDGPNVKYAAEIKKHISTPVATVGALGEPEMLEDIIASGKADVVELARSLIADPDLPNKIRAGREDDIKVCMRCLSCFSSELLYGEKYCAVNPESGYETEHKHEIPQAKTKKKVLIAGGGIGGMQAAITCAERGHEVILCEKNDYLGGNITCEKNVPFKYKLDKYLDRQRRLVAKLPIEVRLNTTVTPEYAKDVKPDVIIAALGARPIVPTFLKGYDLPNVLPAEYAYTHTDEVGKDVVILGAGLVGLELGIYLSILGHSVKVVEMMDHINDGGNILHASGLRVELKKRNVEVNLSTTAKEITPEGIIGETAEGEKLFKGDTVIYAIGQRPLREEACELQFCAPEFFMIGDCVSPKNITNATSTAFEISNALGRF